LPERRHGRLGTLTPGVVRFTIDADPDGDGLTTGEELADGTDPFDPDSDDDGYDDRVERTAQCNPLDGGEVPLQPTLYQGTRGGGQLRPNQMMTYGVPTKSSVATRRDPACAPAGLCSTDFCTVGKIGDPCATRSDCDQPATTCRLLVNFHPDVTDVVLEQAEWNRAPLAGVMVTRVGCSRKLDLPIEPNVSNRLRLKGSGIVTPGGRRVIDRDTFRFRR
jgi:hypothetical protein